MKISFQRTGWFLLLVTLLLAGSGIALRVSNEAQNRNIITVIDYREFQKASDLAGYQINQVLASLKKAGVEYAAVKEVSLRDLEYRGNIKLYEFGVFKAETALKGPQYQAEIEALEKERKISPAALTAVCWDDRTAGFLAQNLNKRFASHELVTAEIGGNRIFIINTQIQRPPKTAEKIYPRDVLVGFEEETLSFLKKQGFEIVLCPGNTTGAKTAYIDDYEKLASAYDVRYVVINGEVPGGPEKLEKIENLIREKHLIVGIIETSSQLGFLPQKGLDKVIAAVDYPVNRVYSTRNDEYLKDINERYYRWVRAVVDRGIRILYVVPFEDEKLTYAENLDNTVDKIGEFHHTVSSKGFNLNQPLPHLNPKIPGSWHYFLVALSLLWALLLYINYLVPLKPAYNLILAALGVLGALLANIVLKIDLAKLYALGAAVIYPSLSSLLLILYLRKYQQQGFIPKLLAALGIILGINALGMYTVLTSLADIRYIMNIEYFRGVKLAFILPLLLFALNYVQVVKGERRLGEYIMDILKKQPNYLVLILMGMALLAIYYYIARSGHTGEVKVSALEIRIREVLETIFLARPRFKEIIIGYPSLMLMVYLYHRYKKDWLLFVFGLGTVIGSISMVNSFCHVFTAAAVSLNRTLNGLLTGLLIGTAVLALFIALEKLYAGKIWQKNR